MTDIDSLMCEISTSDFFQNILAGVSKKFHKSNFQESHPSGIKGMDKKFIGKI